MTEASAKWCGMVLSCLLLSACRPAIGPRNVTSPHAKSVPLGLGIRVSRLYVEPRDGVSPVVRAIDAAKHSVFLSSYILSQHRIVRALERASAQGVGVWVMLEHRPFGLGNQPERMRDQLVAAGIPVRWGRPDFTYSHAKYLVIDDRLAIISTANFSGAAFTGNREFLVVDVVPRDVRALSGIFRADWNRLPAGPPVKNIVVAPVEARVVTEKLVRLARHTIEIYAEELADPRTAELLIVAARRGVVVRILLPTTTPATLRTLRRGRVQVRFLRSPYAHAKVIGVDGRLALIGSQNLSTTSFDRNREVSVLVDGRGLQKVLSVFTRDWQGSNAGNVSTPPKAGQ